MTPSFKKQEIIEILREAKIRVKLADRAYHVFGIEVLKSARMKTWVVKAEIKGLKLNNDGLATLKSQALDEIRKRKDSEKAHKAWGFFKSIYASHHNFR